MKIARLLLLTAIAVCVALGSARACGTERWPPKVLQDPDAPKINPVPQETTISALQSLAAPSSLPYDGRIAPTEYTVYRLRNVTLWWMHTSSDNDYHIEVQDAAGHSMITESPDPACLGTQWFSQTSAVRKMIAERYTVTSSGPKPNVPVTITGVGFFDYILAPSSNPGESPNGIELHPLLSICFGLNCSPITANPAAVAMTPNGGTAPIAASEEYYSGTFAATSANTSIATVSGTGPGFTITGHTAGSTTVTITDTQYNSVTVPVNVTANAGFTYAPGTASAPLTPFYTYKESGAISRQMDASAQGARTNETITESGGETGSNFGWVTASGVPGVTAWPARTYTVHLQVTSPNANLRITEVKLLRLDASAGPNSSGLAVVGDLANLSQSLGTVGTLSFNITGAAQAATATDRFAVKFYIANASSATQSFSYEAGSGTESEVEPAANATPSPLPTPTATPTPAPTVAPTATPSATPVPTSTPVPVPSGAGSYATAVLADAPTRFYQFAETGGTQAADSSGNNATATYAGAVSYAQPGPLRDESSTAIGLSGGSTSAGVSVPNPGAASGLPYSIETWLYWIPASGYESAWGYDSAHRLLVSSNGTLLTQFGTNFFSKHALTPNVWHDVVFVYDAASSTASYYIDGALDSTATISNASGAFNSRFFLGQYDTSASYKWNGRIGEAAFYRSALSAAQVSSHYQTGGYGSSPAPSPTPTITPAPSPTPTIAPAPSPTPTIAPAPSPTPAITPTAAPPQNGPYAAAVLSASPVQYYKFDEAGGTTAADSSGNGANGTYIGAVTFGAAGPLVNETSASIAMAGASAQVGAGAPNPNASAGTSYSIEVWVYPLQSSGYTTIWGYNSTHRLLVSSNGFLLTQLSGNFFSKNTIAPNRWHQIVFTYDAPSGTASYYIDGIFDSGSSVANSAAAFTAPYFFGQYDSSANYKWNGRLSQAAFYGTALTQQQISAHYAAATQPQPSPSPTP